ncbi:MAG TPA: NAD-dependent epimerase/dehydratase family protein [Nocardioides sp.]|uniref:NAD-dependent epimerase/dehydratase family protein n=1 Tax=uncultured Nocardioides sp. TaxID=198441 RepID=UPI0026222058|nr:NAD-dependent epimerase/dehydratase family protein [uncultured Nocardioides sp.]HRD61752.1 NAD-dependent epimerase/dehydratase family protein [Nocardioides sp.]HRI96649.1 NAD-dependent epimerase/dehydratase family protein [Nocardioides sp.]
MRLLVLGGTVNLSRAVAAEGVRRGHEVTCAARGTSGAVPEGAELIEVDRTRPLPDLGRYDAVVDVARQPSWVRSAVAAYPDSHWVFVSTVNVYADDATPHGTPATLPLVEAIEEDVDLAERPEAYGPMKVACERIVLDGATSAMVIRPGLIVGPGDPTGRFSYWPRRLAAGGEVLAPGDPGDLMQVADVRDLAAWAVTASEQRTIGVYDGVGEPLPMADLLTQCADGVAAECSFTWVDQAFLQEQQVEPWMGPDAIPLWLPRPEYDGLPAHDVRPSLDAGLTIRPLADTTADTLAWLEATPDAPVSGISLDRERELLAAWHARPPR